MRQRTARQIHGLPDSVEHVRISRGPGNVLQAAAGH